MWDLIVSVPDHCLSFYFVDLHHIQVLCRTKVSSVYFFMVWQMVFSFLLDILSTTRYFVGKPW